MQLALNRNLLLPRAARKQPLQSSVQSLAPRHSHRYGCGQNGLRKTAQCAQRLDNTAAVFIVHHGKRPESDELAARLDCMKQFAMDVKSRLEAAPNPISTFVDEADLKSTGDAERELRNNLFQCELALVLFCDDFFSSKDCVAELTMVIEHGAKRQRFEYLPVFYTITVEELKQLARANGKDEDFIKQMVRPSGIRHKDEHYDGKRKRRIETLAHICSKVRAYFSCPPPPAWSDGAQPAVSSAAAAAAANLSAVGVTGPGPASEPAQQPVEALARSEPSAEAVSQSAVRAAAMMLMQKCMAIHLSSCSFTTTHLCPTAGAKAACERHTADVQQVLPDANAAAHRGCVRSVVELPPNSSHTLLGSELLKWVQQLGHSERQAQPGTGISTGVVSVSAGGGLMAWCQQGWGVWLPPNNTLPSLEVFPRVLPVSRKSADVLIVRSCMGDHNQVLVKQGATLHSLQMQPDPGHADVTSLRLRGALGSGARPWHITVPASAMEEEDLLLLSWSTGRFYCSTPQPVLVLDVDEAVAQELNSMVLLHTGDIVLVWLHTLLLQGDSQLSLYQTLCDSNNFKTGSSSPATQPDSDPNILLGDAECQVAALRATAAHALLAEAIKHRKRHVVSWVLARLAEQRAWKSYEGIIAEAVLVEQQRVATDLRLPLEETAVQQPLLVLAAMFCPDDEIMQVIAEWSSQHNLLADVGTEVGQQLLRRAAGTSWQTDLRQPKLEVHFGEIDVKTNRYPWDKGNMLKAASLEELATVLGPEGDLAVAVMANKRYGFEAALNELLRSQEHSLQQQLDEALELAALLGNSRLAMVHALVRSGAKASSRGAAALRWARQRSGEPKFLLLHALESSLQGDRLSTPPSAGSSSSSGAYNLAVAAWCMGLQQELSALRSSTMPRPQLQSLRQFMLFAEPGQCTVAALLRQLRKEYPELFPDRPRGGAQSDDEAANIARRLPRDFSHESSTKWSSDDEATIKLPAEAEIDKVYVLDDLRPTQLCVGMQQVHAKVKKIRKIMDDDDKDGTDLKNFLKDNPVPCVIGDEGRWYMIDHHHFACALYQLGIKKCYAGILPGIDYSRLSGADFWQAMWDHRDSNGDEQPLAWLYDQNGDLLIAEAFADKMKRCKDVSDLKDDKYRSLAALVRKADPPGYYKTTVAFAEFKWANYLRKNMKLPDFTDPDDVKDDEYIRKGVAIARMANDFSLPGLVNSAPTRAAARFQRPS